MAKTFKRSLFFNTTKYQIRLLFPVLIASLIIIICLAFFIYLSLNTSAVVYENIDRTYIYKQTIGEMGEYVPFITGIFSISVIFIIFWSYSLSNRVVGPHERIIKELDNIIEGTHEIKPLYTREGDDMFEELVKRINILLEGYQRFKSEQQ